jgi:hypothetical protein
MGLRPTNADERHCGVGDLVARLPRRVSQRSGFFCSDRSRPRAELFLSGIESPRLALSGLS